MFTSTPKSSHTLIFGRRFRNKQAPAAKAQTKAPVPVDSHQKQKRVARARAQVRRECVAILNKCAVFGCLDMAAGFIKTGQSPAKVQKRLMAARDKQLRVSQGKSRISNRLATVTETQKGNLAANMKRRLAEMGMNDG